MRKRLLILGSLFVVGSCILKLNAQDPELSQYYAAPVYTNPALAGSAVCNYGAAGRVALNYRNQWPGLPGTFRSFAASWDQHIPSIGGGLGAMVFSDVAGSGLLTSTTISGVYSYLLPLARGKVYMRFGLQGAVTFKSIDFNKLRFGDQIVPTQGFVNPTAEQKPATNITYPNFNAGWIMYTSKFYIGLASHNIIEPNWSFYENPAALDIENRANHLQGQAEPLFCFLLINGGRRRVFLHMDPFLIEIDGQVILRDITVIDPETGDLLFLCPRQNDSAVLDQAVGKILTGAVGIQGKGGPDVRGMLHDLTFMAHQQLAFDRPIVEPVPLFPDHAGHLRQILAADMATENDIGDTEADNGQMSHQQRQGQLQQ